MSQTPPASRHPPKPRLTVRVGITGHRPNKLDDDAAARVARQLPLIFSAIEDVAAESPPRQDAAFPGSLSTGCLPPRSCGFAEGADQMAVAACPSGWQIEAVLPFPHDEYLKDFSQSANGDGTRGVFASPAPIPPPVSSGLPPVEEHDATRARARLPRRLPRSD